VTEGQQAQTAGEHFRLAKGRRARRRQSEPGMAATQSPGWGRFMVVLPIFSGRIAASIRFKRLTEG
jgi:hypothetical protein